MFFWHYIHKWFHGLSVLCFVRRLSEGPCFMACAGFSLSSVVPAQSSGSGVALAGGVLLGSRSQPAVSLHSLCRYSCPPPSTTAVSSRNLLLHLAGDKSTSDPSASVCCTKHMHSPFPGRKQRPPSCCAPSGISRALTDSWNDQETKHLKNTVSKCWGLTIAYVIVYWVVNGFILLNETLRNVKMMLVSY